MFVSDLGGATIIDERNWRDFVVPPQADGEPAYIPRDYDAHPVGSYQGGNPFPAELLIPESEWKERIEEMERKKTRISDMIATAPRRWLNQSPTNYCWCYAVVHAIMIARHIANLPYARLSPFSLACVIKNYRNIGGWGSQALEGAIKWGVADEKFWPQETPEMNSSERSRANMSAINNGRQYFAASRASALEHTVTEFYDLRPRSWKEKISCLLRRMPVASGYNWMGHEMTSIDAVILPNGRVGCTDMDHYGSNGNYNKRAMSESQGTADDGVVPLVSPPKKSA